MPSLPAGKAIDGFVEEGAFEGEVRFGFQGKGNRKTQGREEGNMGKRKKFSWVARETNQMLEPKEGRLESPIGIR